MPEADGPRPEEPPSGDPLKVDILFEKEIMADYRVADYLGRDLVPVETEKRY